VQLAKLTGVASPKRFSMPVQVKAGRYTTITIRIDIGIRVMG
jgi:hypothetical protein